MPYLGKSLAGSSSIRRFNVTSSTSATHTLTWAPPTEQSIIVSINGVKQHEDAYSISGTTLTLTNALVATDKMEVIGINDVGTTVTAAQGSVNTDKLADDAVTTAKIADDQITTAKIADDQITTAKIADDSIQSLKNRNLIINGAMNVAQRGTQVTGATAGGYLTCDRFYISLSNLGTWTVDQSTDAPNGFSNSFKVTCTTADASPAASDYFLFAQRTEAQNLQHLAFGTADAKSMTLSFWVKSNKTGSASFGILQRDNSNKMISKSYTINSANTWEYKTISVPADTAGVINNDNGEGFQIEWWLNSGTDWSSGSLQSTWSTQVNTNRNPSNLGVGGAVNDYFAITGVQLELNDVATPFEHESYAETLQKCLRYYYKTDNLGVGVGTNSTSINLRTSFNVFMRTSPTASVAGTNWEISDDYSGDATAATPTIGTTYSASNSSWRGMLSGFTGIGTGRFYGCRPSSTSLIAFDAEL